jgi:hypothetical protein
MRFLLPILCLAALLHAHEPGSVASQARNALKEPITCLSKFDRDQLLAYVAGLDLPDNAVKRLYPKYIELMAEIDQMNLQGLGDAHSLVAPKVKELALMRAQLNEAMDGLNLQPKRDRTGQQVSEAADAKLPPLFAQAVKHLKPAELAREKTRLKTALEAMAELSDERLLVFAAGLEVWMNKVRAPYLEYLARKKLLGGTKDSGHDTDDSTLRENEQDLAKIRKQLDEQIASLRNALDNRLKGVNLALFRDMISSSVLPRIDYTNTSGVEILEFIRSGIWDTNYLDQDTARPAFEYRCSPERLLKKITFKKINISCQGALSEVCMLLKITMGIEQGKIVFNDATVIGSKSENHADGKTREASQSPN